MKLKKIFLVLAGIIKVVVGGLFTLFGGLVLLLSSAVRSLFSNSFELVENFVKELSVADASYSYLLDYTKDQQLDYVINIINIVCIVCLLIGLISILFAVLNFVFSRRLEDMTKKGKIILIVFQWVIAWGILANTLTTLGLFLKTKTPKVDISKQENIANYHC